MHEPQFSSYIYVKTVVSGFDPQPYVWACFLIVIGDFDVSCLLLAYTLWLFNIAMEAMAHL